MLNRLPFAFRPAIALVFLYCAAFPAVFARSLSHARPPEACDVPALLQADQITDTSARLTWTDVGEVYEIELRETGVAFTGTPTHVTSSDPPFIVTGLGPGRSYRFVVRNRCEGTTLSAWSNPRTFTTDLNNAFPCPFNIPLRDSSCNNIQIIRLHTNNAPGDALGVNVLLQGVRLVVEHPWRSDLRIFLRSPDGFAAQLVNGLNAGDQNIGAPVSGACGRFVELTDRADALPLSAAAEQDNFFGYYNPVEPLSGFHKGQNPNGVWQIEICDSKPVHTGRLRAFELVFSRPGCPPVTAVNATDVGISAAQIQWTNDMPTGDSLLVEYGPAGFHPGVSAQPGTGSLALWKAATDTQALLTNLAPLQEYEVYVRRRCAPGLWSANTAALRFFTNCLPTLSVNYDTLTTCPDGCSDPCPLPGMWQNAADDDYEWKVRSGPGLTYPTAGPPAAPEGIGNYLFFRNSCSFNGAAGKKAILRTTCVEVFAPADQPCHFSFDLYMNTKLGQMSTLQLQVSTDGGVSWKNMQTWAGNRGKRWRREYVSLSDYHGQIVLFQLVATGTYGAYGDVALDNLTFYGSQPAGTPDYLFYRDLDGDGYGDPELRLIACNPETPPGYSPNSGDCDDSTDDVYPGAPERICNNRDDNCNGMDDDRVVPTPEASASVICRGENAVFTALGAPHGRFYWFDAEIGGQLADTGRTVHFDRLLQTKTLWLLDSISTGGCKSERKAVTAVIQPTPDLILDGPTGVCAGAEYKLETTPLKDRQNSGGLLSFYTSYPFIPSNKVAETAVSPLQNTNYYAHSVAPSGCADTLAFVLKVNAYPSVSISQGDSTAVCKNKNASLSAVGTGGEAPYRYLWSNGLRIADIPAQAVGPAGSSSAFTVTLTDANGCTASDAISVYTLPSVTQLSVESVSDVSVCGGSDGGIVLRPLDGVAPYSFVWSGPTSGEAEGIAETLQISGLKQGGYRVAISDASGAGCQIVLPQILINAPGLKVQIDTILQPRCPDDPGAIRLKVAGVQPQIIWNTGQNGSALENVAPGTYAVTITDGACQQIINQIRIEAPEPIQILTNQLKNNPCFGGDEGLIDLAVFGATPPYQYTWSNGKEGRMIGSLPAGPYQCTITDARGCAFLSPTYNITQAPPLSVPASVDHVSCFEGTDGAISVLPVGGTPPYVFQWSTGSKDSTIEDLKAGDYAFTLTDAAGCVIDKQIKVISSAALNVAIARQLTPACEGLQTGAVDLAVSGGQAPYEIRWNNGQSGPSIEGLDKGAYQASITDAAGCAITSPLIALTPPQPLRYLSRTITPIRCFGENNGQIALSIGGATGVLSARWNGEAGDLSRDHLPAGDYYFEAKDEKGCALRDTFRLTQAPQPLSLAVESVQAALCAGEPTGRIDILVEGGIAPYAFQWNNGADTEDLSAVPAGSYTLSVGDARGCNVALPPVTVTQPPAIIVVPAVKDIPCFGPTSGSITLEASGGIGPLSFQWSTGSTARDQFNLPEGNYGVTIQDATGCAVVLNELQVKSRVKTFELTAKVVEPVSCPGKKDGYIIVQTANGAAPFQFAWSAPVGLHPNVQTPEDRAIGLNGGTYAVTVTDAAGCARTLSGLKIEEGPPMEITLGEATPIVCKGETTGALPGKASGGVPPYHYLWNNGATTPALSQVAAGAYRLTVTDFRGCTVVSKPTTIGEPSIGLSASLDSIREDRCGRGEGAIFTRQSGGYPPYIYQWSNGAKTDDITQLLAGEYQLTLSDQRGCKYVSPTYKVTAPASPIALTSQDVKDVLCFGAKTGAIAVNATGGAPALRYLWNTGQEGPSIADLAAGIYRLTVTDAKSCTAQFNLTVRQPAIPLGVQWTADSLSAGWSVSLNITGAYPPFMPKWDNKAGGQTTSVVHNLPRGAYEVTVTDQAGCTTKTRVFVGVSAEKEDWVAADISLQPNPASDGTWLNIISETPQAWRVEVFSAAGRLLSSRHTPERQAEQRIWIDAHPLPPGVYWIRIQNEAGGLALRRFVKI